MATKTKKCINDYVKVTLRIALFTVSCYFMYLEKIPWYAWLIGCAGSIAGYEKIINAVKGVIKK